MSNINTRIFNCNGTLGQPNRITGPCDITEERIKSKTRSGKEIEIIRIKRTAKDISEFTKQGIQKKQILNNILSRCEEFRCENQWFLYSSDLRENELIEQINEDRNKSIQKFYKKCENKCGNIDFEKYKLYHPELEKLAIPLKDIKVSKRRTSNEITQYLWGWGFV